MKRLRFGLDLDGVFGDFGEHVKQIANRIWPGKLSDDYIPNNWDYTDIFTKEDWDKVWIEIKATPDFWFYEKHYPNAVEQMQRFLRKHYREVEIYYITSRVATAGDSVLQQSSIWLSKLDILPPYRSSVIPVKNADDKIAICTGLKLKFLLDDYAPTIQKLQQVEGMNAYLLDQPWNRYAEHLPRVFSVQEYLEIVAAQSQ